MSRSYIKKYNELWLQGIIDSPIVLLIGGYAGTGKSTLAKRLASHFPFATVLQTAVVRAVLRTTITRKENPFLYEHTYNLAEIQEQPEKEIPLPEKYLEQTKPIIKAINKIADFSGTEKQERIIEGAHIVPRFLQLPSSIIPVELYLKVSDPEKHKTMITGPTHNRKLTKEQWASARTLHDYIVHECVSSGKEVYEYEDAYEKSLLRIDTALKNYFEI